MDNTSALAKLGLSAKAITVETIKDMGCEVVSFLPRIELMTSSKEAAKSGKYTGQPNTFVLLESGGGIVSIGKVMEVVLLDWRPLAVDFKAKTRFFDEELDAFKDIQKRADASGESNCGYGPQFLVYIPEINKCAVWWANNKSSKFAWNAATSNYVPEDGSYNGKVLEFTSRFHQFKKASQQIPVLTFKPDREVDLEAVFDVIKDGAEKFQADVTAATENAEATNTSGRAR